MCKVKSLKDVEEIMEKLDASKAEKQEWKKLIDAIEEWLNHAPQSDNDAFLESGYGEMLSMAYPEFFPDYTLFVEPQVIK